MGQVETLAEAWVRTRDDPLRFVNRLVTIEDRNNRVRLMDPLLYEQQRWFELLCENNQVLGVKPRQVGFTTATMAFLFWKTFTSERSRKVVQLVHEDDARIRLAHMLRVMLRELPPELRVHARPDNKAMTRLPHNGGLFYRQLAGGSGQGRSWTINDVHATEMSKWRSRSASSRSTGSVGLDEETWTSVLAAQHDPTGHVIVESTGNGPQGMYYELYQRARESSGWALHFLPWSAVPDYRIPLTDIEALDLRKELDDDEKQLVKNHELTMEQIAWRRWKIRTQGSSKLTFKREYPLVDTDPFILDESGWFENGPLEQMLRMCPDLGKSKHPMRIFRPYDPRRRYVLAVDTAGGHPPGSDPPRRKDESCIQVLQDDGMHAAVWASKHAYPSAQAQQVVRLSGLFGGNSGNRPLTIIEGNHFGQIVEEEVRRIGGCWLYQDDKGKPFWTSGRGAGQTKREVMDHGRTVLDSGESKIADAETIRQAMTVVEKPNGKIEGSGDSHDDRIFAYCLGLWAIRKWARYNPSSAEGNKRRVRRIMRITKDWGTGGS